MNVFFLGYLHNIYIYISMMLFQKQIPHSRTNPHSWKAEFKQNSSSFRGLIAALMSARWTAFWSASVRRTQAVLKQITILFGSLKWKNFRIDMKLYGFPCICICKWKCICIWYVFMYLCIYVFMYLCIYVFMYLCIYMYMLDMHVYVHILTCKSFISIYVYSYACISYTYITYMRN